MSQGIHLFPMGRGALTQANFGGDGRRRMNSIQACGLSDGVCFHSFGASPGPRFTRREDFVSLLHTKHIVSRKNLLVCKRPLYSIEKQSCILAFAMKTVKSHGDGLGKQKKVQEKKDNEKMKAKSNKQSHGIEDSEHPQPEPVSVKQSGFTSASNSSQFKPSSKAISSESDIVALFMKVKSQPKEVRQVKDKDHKVHMSGAKPKGTADSVLKVLQQYSHQGDQQINKSLQHATGGEGDSSAQSSKHEPLSKARLQESGTANGGSLKVSSQATKAGYRRPPSNFVRRSPVPALVVAQQDQVVSASSQPGGNGFEDASHKLEHNSEKQLESSLKCTIPNMPDSLAAANARQSESPTIGAAVQAASSLIEQMDLSTLRLPEMRIIAKSRGLKGYSKLKKADLLDLLREGTN